MLPFLGRLSYAKTPPQSSTSGVTAAMRTLKRDGILPRHVPERVANIGRNRNGKHDSKRTSEMGGQRRCQSASQFGSETVRYRG